MDTLLNKQKSQLNKRTDQVIFQHSHTFVEERVTIDI